MHHARRERPPVPAYASSTTSYFQNAPPRPRSGRFGKGMDDSSVDAHKGDWDRRACGPPTRIRDASPFKGPPAGRLNPATMRKPRRDGRGSVPGAAPGIRLEFPIDGRGRSLNQFCLARTPRHLGHCRLSKPISPSWWRRRSLPKDGLPSSARSALSQDQCLARSLSIVSFFPRHKGALAHGGRYWERAWEPPAEFLAADLRSGLSAPLRRESIGSAMVKTAPARAPNVRWLAPCLATMMSLEMESPRAAALSPPSTKEGIEDKELLHYRRHPRTVILDFADE
jgi:hypothetical protein